MEHIGTSPLDHVDLLREISSRCAMCEILILCNVSRRHRAALVPFHIERMRRYIRHLDHIKSVLTAPQPTPKRYSTQSTFEDCVRVRREVQRAARRRFLQLSAAPRTTPLHLRGEWWTRPSFTFPLCGLLSAIATLMFSRYYGGEWRINRALGYAAVGTSGMIVTNRFLSRAVSSVNSPLLFGLLTSMYVVTTALAWQWYHRRFAWFKWIVYENWWGGLAFSANVKFVGICAILGSSLPLGLTAPHLVVEFERTRDDRRHRDELETAIKDLEKKLSKLWMDAEWDRPSHGRTHDNP